MKKFIYILVLSLFVFNCSKDDDEDINITFLEKYEDTTWLNNDDGNTLYFRFINNITTPFEIWFDWGDCYVYSKEYIDEFTITENSNDLFEFNFVEIDEGVEYLDIIRLTVFDNTLEIESKYYIDGSLQETDVFYCDSTDDDVDNLPLCD